MLARQPRKTRQHATRPTHTTQLAPSPNQLARNSRYHATYTSTLPTQARHPRQHATHANMPPTLARHIRKHAIQVTHASTNSTPFLKPLKERTKCISILFYISILFIDLSMFRVYFTRYLGTAFESFTFHFYYKTITKKSKIII